MQFPTLVARISALELGPPVGWPVQYRVSGPDLAQVRDIAFRLAQIVATNRDAVNVNFDWIEPAREVHIRVDQDKARLLGLSSQALASVLNTVITGTTISQVRDDIYLVDVIARATREQRVSLETLQDPASPSPQRAHRSAEPVRNLRVRPGLPGGLAPRPCPDPDRAGRRRTRSAAGDSGRVLCPCRRRSDQVSRRIPTRSSSAARSRRAASRRPPSSPWCR